MRQLTTENIADRERCYALWLELGSVAAVSLETEVPVSTLHRWRNADGWEDRKANIQTIIQESVDTEVGKVRTQLADHLVEMMESVRHRFADTENGTMLEAAKAFSELAKSHALIVGAPTKREEQVTTSHVTFDVSSLYDAADEANHVQVIDVEHEDTTLEERQDAVLNAIAEQGITLEEEPGEFDAPQ
tara:strand:+ start:1848 stop:2414 length:567 start_codon:yes stop_codon:yes gene_type:complete